MRLSGLAAGIATFAVLEITHNLLRYEEKIGPGLNTFSSVPETTGLRQAALGALVVVVVAFAYSRSRFGRLLRATREDDAAARAVGASVYRQRLIAFAISGALCGLAGGLYVHLLPLNTETVYLDLTFITLAMLVDRRRDEPVGRGRRRARRQRARLVPRGGRERHVVLRLAHRPARGHARDRRRRADGDRPDPAAVRPDRRARVQAVAEMTRVCVAGAGVIGSLFAAHLARVAEVSALVRRDEHARALADSGLRVSGRARVHRPRSRPPRRRRAAGAASS